MQVARPASSSSIPPGKLIRAPFLYQSERPIVIAPIDDHLIFGPRNGLESQKEALRKISSAGPDAILTFAGAAKSHPGVFAKTPFIMNLTASTTLSMPSRKVVVHRVEDALRLSACAVAVHVNTLSPTAGRMLENAGALISRCERFELPVLGIIYPRGEQADGQDDDYLAMQSTSPDEYAELVAHSVAIGVDLGFDAIKTKFTGTTSSFKRVVDVAGDVPVLVAGGKLVPLQDALLLATGALAAGAAGISFGRNLFGRARPSTLVRAVRRMERVAS